MKLIVVRHGETVENVNKIVQGHTHGTLSEKGLEQARKLAKRLEKEHFDVVFSSDLGRAVDTAKEICKYHKAKLILTKQLRELDRGIFQGKTRQEWIDSVEKSGMKRHEFRPEKGENYSDVHKRAIKFYKTLIENYTNKTVLVVTHGTFGKILLAAIMKKSVEEASHWHLGNASLSVIDIKKNGHEVILLNSVDHL